VSRPAAVIRNAGIPRPEILSKEVRLSHDGHLLLIGSDSEQRGRRKGVLSPRGPGPVRIGRRARLEAALEPAPACRGGRTSCFSSWNIAPGRHPRWR